jgi:hypothetical protein
MHIHQAFNEFINGQCPTKIQAFACSISWLHCLP